MNRSNRHETKKCSHYHKKYYLHDNSLIFLLEPSDSIFFADLVSDSDSSWSDLTSSNSISRSDQNYVEIHTKNTCVWNNIKV